MPLSDIRFVLSVDNVPPPSWRRRVHTDPLCLALINSNATDAQAADHYAARYDALMRQYIRLSELTARPMSVVDLPGYPKPTK